MVIWVSDCEKKLFDLILLLC